MSIKGLKKTLTKKYNKGILSTKELANLDGIEVILV